LIKHTFTVDEHVSLMTKIFSDYDQVEMVGKLTGDDAQTFIDTVDKVHLPPFHPQRPGGLTLP